MECWLKSVLVCWVSVPGGVSVSDGVTMLLRQTPPGINIIHDSQLRQRTVRGVEGYMTLETALELLVEDTGLMTIHVNSRTITFVTEDMRTDVNERVGPYYNYGRSINGKVKDIQSSRVGSLPRVEAWKDQQTDWVCPRDQREDSQGKRWRSHAKDGDQKPRSGGDPSN